MSNIGAYLIPVVLAAVVASLALGLASFMREGPEHRARSNRLMRWRVGFQLLAVALMALFVFFGSSGR